MSIGGRTTTRPHPETTRLPATGVPVLGIDVGSTNLKAVLVLLDADEGAAREVAVRRAPTPDDPAALVRAVLDLVRSVLDGRPPPQAVGIASMAETGVPLADDDRPLTDLLRWDGRRGALDAERLTAELGHDDAFAATGVRPAPKVPLVTWSWLRRTHPVVWDRMARWAGAADLVGLALTGRLVTDHTLAGRTMAYRLPPAGDPLPAGFDAELLAVAGLRADRLPEVVPPGGPAGRAVDPAFVAAGVPSGTPVVIAGHDHQVGAWAAGLRDPGDRADSVGTAEAVMTVLGAPVDRVRAARQGMSLVRTTAGTHDALLAGSPAAGAMVRWWLDRVLPGRALADAAPPAPAWTAGRMLVLPYPHGRQSPRPDPAACVRVLDETGREMTVDEVAAPAGGSVPPRAVRATVAMLEGLALQAAWMLAEQGRLAVPTDGVLAGRGVTPLRVLGGAGGTNALWMGLKAAVTGGPADLVTAGEPVATGAALLAAERAGLVPPGVVRLGHRRLEPLGPPPPDGGWPGALDRFVAAATHDPALTRDPPAPSTGPAPAPAVPATPGAP